MAAPGGIPPLWLVGTEFEIYVYLTGSNETSRGVVLADDGVIPTAAAPGSAGLPDPLNIQGKGPLILYEVQTHRHPSAATHPVMGGFFFRSLKMQARC